MSRVMKIDYKAISIRCKVTCVLAFAQMPKLDQMINKLKNESKSLLFRQNIELQEELKETKSAIRKKINSVFNIAKRYEKKGIVVVDSVYMGEHANANNAIDEAEELLRMVNKVLSVTLIEFETMLNQLLKEDLEMHQKTLNEWVNEKVAFDLDFIENLKGVQDAVLKQYIYCMWVAHQGRPFSQMLKFAQEKKAQAEAKQFETAALDIVWLLKAELEKEKIPPHIIYGALKADSKDPKERIEKIRASAFQLYIDVNTRRLMGN